MKAPLCPKCETHHWSTQRCPAEGTRKVYPRPPENFEASALIRSDAKILADIQMQGDMTPAERHEQEIVEEKLKALTPAQKQKRWRTTGDVEGKRRSNAERMKRERKQRKRDG